MASPQGMKPCQEFSFSLPTSNGPAAVEGIATKAVGCRAEDGGAQRVAGLDGVAELDVAHDHRPRRGCRDDCRSRRASIQHPDLAEEIAGVKRRPPLAVHLDRRLSIEQDVEAVRGVSLLDQGFARL